MAASVTPTVFTDCFAAFVTRYVRAEFFGITKVAGFAAAFDQLTSTKFMIKIMAWLALATNVVIALLAFETGATKRNIFTAHITKISFSGENVRVA